MGILGGVGFYRLPSQWVHPSFQAMLNQTIGPVYLEISQARIRWGGWRHPLGIRVRHVVIEKEKQGLSIKIPEVLLSLKVLPLLWGQAEIGGCFFDAAKIHYKAHLLGTVSGKAKSRGQKLLLQTSFADLNATGLIHLLMGCPYPTEASLPINGSLTLEGSQKEGLEDLSIRCECNGGKLIIPDIYLSPVSLDKVQFVLIGNKKSLSLKKLSLNRGHASLTALGMFHTPKSWKTLYEKGGQVYLSLKGQGAAIPIDDLRLLWPHGLSPKPRYWVVNQLSRGNADYVTTHMEGTIHILPGGKIASFDVPQIQGDIEASGIVVDYFGKLPPVVNTQGKCYFTRQQFFIDAVGIAHGIEVTRGKIVIRGLHATDQTIDIKLDLEGPVRNSLEIIDSKPLYLARKLDLDPAHISGHAQTYLHLTFPLETDVPLSAINVIAQSKILGGKVIYEAQLAGKPIQVDRGTLFLNVSKKFLDMKGKGFLQDVETQIHWQEYFGDRPIPFRRQFHLQGLFDLGKLENFGIHATDYLAGQVPASVRYTTLPDGQGIIEGTADLTPAVMVSPVLLWQKEKGEGAHLKVSMHKSPNQRGYVLDTAYLVAPQLSMMMEGKGDMKTNYFEISRLHMGKNRLSSFINHDQDGIRVEVRGKTLDLSYMLDDSAPRPLIKPSSLRNKENDTKVSVKVNLDKILLGEKNSVHQVNGDIQYEGNTLKQVYLKGRALHNNEPISLNMVPLDFNRQQFTLESGDGGHLLGMLGAGYDVEGGQLVMKGVKTEYDLNNAQDKEKIWKIVGDINIENFTITKAPLLARLLSAASLQGIVNFFSGRGIHFHEGKAEFSLTPNRLDLSKVRLLSPSLGLLLKGFIDREHHKVDFIGELIPLYMVNMLLAQIPLIGGWISGGREDGVFMTRFTLTGNRQDPDLMINPITSVTPGLMRELFTAQEAPS